MTWKSLAVVVSVGLALVAVSVQDALGQAVAAGGTPGPSVPTFQVDPAWPNLPNDWVMGHPSSVAVDRHDHVWVIHRPRTVPADRTAQAAPPVLEFDADGTFVQGWGGPAGGYEWPETEHAIFVDASDHVWIGGSNPISNSPSPSSDDMLLKFTKTGEFVLQVGRRNQSSGNRDTDNLKRPADIFVHASTNEVFVADGYGNRRVIVLDADTGAFKRMWGAFGRAPVDDPPAPPATARAADGEGSPHFGIVHGLEVSRDGLVYVADRGNSRIQVFSLDGKYVTQVFINRNAPSSATAAGIAFSPDREQQFMYVADYGNSRIVVVDRKRLEVVDQFGEKGPEPGNFRSPHHIATDSKGNLYTAEVVPGARVQRFVFKGMAVRSSR